MSYEVIMISVFEKKLKKLIKKYPELKTSILNLVESLETNPIQGTSIGRNFYKIRLALPGKNKGKSGGARVITHIKFTNSRVYLANIYDKADVESLTKEDLDYLFELIN